MFVGAEGGVVDGRVAEPLDEVLEFFWLELSVGLDKLDGDEQFGDAFELDK